jgi:hypothetical protein
MYRNTIFRETTLWLQGKIEKYVSCNNFTWHIAKKEKHEISQPPSKTCFSRKQHIRH